MENTKITILEKVGGTREAAYRAIVSGLTATKMTVDKFGDEHIEDDHTARLRSAELIARMNGDLKGDNAIDNRVINVSIGKEEFGILLSVATDVKNQLAKLHIEGHQTGEIIDI